MSNCLNRYMCVSLALAVSTQVELRSGSLAEQQSKPHMVLVLPGCCFMCLH